MNISAGFNNILDRLDCYVSRITAFMASIGGSLSKKGYS